MTLESTRRQQSGKRLHDSSYKAKRRSGEDTETKIKAEVELIDCVWEYHAALVGNCDVEAFTLRRPLPPCSSSFPLGTATRRLKRSGATLASSQVSSTVSHHHQRRIPALPWFRTLARILLRLSRLYIVPA